MKYKNLKFEPHEFNSLGDYRFADIIAVCGGKWVFCKHKERNTWETPGGHIEAEEQPLETAKRELYEETGATSFDIEPLCDYWTSGELNGVSFTAHGQVYFANIHTFEEIPYDSEMEKIILTDSIPNEQTYPDYIKAIFPLALKRHNIFT